MTAGEEEMATVQGLLGRKVGMTTVFTEAGNAIPVTVIQCGPCVIVQHKTVETDGYEAVQLGFEELKEGRKDTKVGRGDNGHRGRGEANKPERGHFAKFGATPMRNLAEFPLLAEGDLPVAGTLLTVDGLFKAGDPIKIQGTTKGRGFSGVIKRHGFKGQKASHGQKIHRKPASNGATDPARTFPGARRPGRFGNELVTQKGLEVVEVDATRNLLVVKGAVPGANGGLLRIEKQTK
jgi:large subunit ribosomal protein L3